MDSERHDHQDGHTADSGWLVHPLSHRIGRGLIQERNRAQHCGLPTVPSIPILASTITTPWIRADWAMGGRVDGQDIVQPGLVPLDPCVGGGGFVRYRGKNKYKQGAAN